MRSHSCAAHHCPIGPSLAQMQTVPAEEMPNARRQLTQVDPMTWSSRLGETQQAEKVRAQILKVRERRIVALRTNIESGHYSVEAEQVAEKIMKGLLLGLFHN